ncbi:response regulator [Pseudaestuariivita atlantica]|uniref:Transcriptional regulatory protein AruR n=1 Tax=Pseudaestuariivita atlantica TaxID=1317121 RepID=A0A0L1JJE4_9RHOB|nr:response regulator transcription factor [Pseudaestuariivita atlantica]KNG91871.1 transcriptional regulatory protein AruR [Pseudaestuariivita atlantica]
MPEQATALVVEDDEKIRRVLRNVLEDDGFAVLEAEDADSALGYVETQKLDLVTLDIQLGKDNGMDVLRRIRAVSGVPVIMVTGKDDVIDRVLGLEIGADDYITKPFHVREVLARIHAVARRYAVIEDQQEEPAIDVQVYLMDGLTIVPDRMELLDRNGNDCGSTTADMALLKIFLERPNRALSRDQLMDLIGGVEWSPLDRTIDNQVARLRKKIERNPAAPKLIKTVRGVGYMLACDVKLFQPEDVGSKSA